MPRLTIAQAKDLAAQAGFTGFGLDIAVAVAMAESSLDPSNTSSNPGSVDRGLWQINSKYHSEVSDACAYDPLCNAKAAYRISNGGKDWSQWTTFRTGAYLKFVNAVSMVTGGNVLPQSIPDNFPTGIPPQPVTPIAPSPPTTVLGGVEGFLQSEVSQVVHFAAINAGLVLLAGLGFYLLFRQPINNGISKAI